MDRWTALSPHSKKVTGLNPSCMMFTCVCGFPPPTFNRFKLIKDSGLLCDTIRYKAGEIMNGRRSPCLFSSQQASNIHPTATIFRNVWGLLTVLAAGRQPSSRRIRAAIESEGEKTQQGPQGGCKRVKFNMNALYRKRQSVWFFSFCRPTHTHTHVSPPPALNMTMSYYITRKNVSKLVAPTPKPPPPFPHRLWVSHLCK